MVTALKDLASLARSLQLICDSSIKLQRDAFLSIFKNSSFSNVVEQNKKDCNMKDIMFHPDVLNNYIQDATSRLLVAAQGLSVYSNLLLAKANLGTKSKSSNFLENSVSFKSPHEIVREINPLAVITLAPGDKELLKKLDREHKLKQLSGMDEQHSKQPTKLENENILSEATTSEHSKCKQKLSENSKARKVPSSRIGRMVSFGTLAAGLGFGTATEYAKRTFGIGDANVSDGSLFLSKGNLERIVDTLCKVRGAALKLGQLLSIQDESVVSPELAKAFERVRKSADFMPVWQVEQVMSGELGTDWKENFLEFEQKPFAAASIGQVHYGKLKNGAEVAVKIQYPGVAKGIESDIDNLGGIMKMWNIFPRGMFLENLMTVAKRELAWEVDYRREAECTRKFKAILSDYKDYYVPNVIDNLSTKEVFTTELLDGVPVDQCFALDYSHREFIGEKVLELCLLEILQFKYMQTDPNWANFLYNPSKRQLLLLDFGASREYSPHFMDKYVIILKASCEGDRSTVLNVSRELGFLTGYESKVMEDAHVDAVMILGEVFRTPGKYNFAHQDMTHRIQDLAQVMLVHRLCPPPEEVYSLHRKLSGVFLLLSKLKVSVECRDKFLALYDQYQKSK
ncbi:atypical kinase COQ8B, mitochondrial [Cylas formicarius]|uniref:atypical kinase COQ8B, mitochondrial n=1 Tax=Cylas formicarius TaxID=197179 RepID=UPI002958842A|nr:atypical kinase COQ8B, mitochondrial [Cylas formicarius]